MVFDRICPGSGNEKAVSATKRDGFYNIVKSGESEAVRQGRMGLVKEIYQAGDIGDIRFAIGGVYVSFFGTAQLFVGEIQIID